MFSPFTWCFYNAVDDGYERIDTDVKKSDRLAVIKENLDQEVYVVSEFFGRSLFNKLTVVTVPPESNHDADTSVQKYEQSASTNLRLQEEQSKQVPDSRTQFIEQQLYSASLEDNVTELEPKIHTKKSPFIHQSDVNKREAPRLSSAIINYSRNPFDETYDESKNPFADYDMNDPTNPFADDDDDDDDDDYDKNLNPFS